MEATVKKYKAELEKDLRKFKSLLKYEKKSDWWSIRKVCEGRIYELECKILKDE